MIEQEIAEEMTALPDLPSEANLMMKFYPISHRGKFRYLSILHYLLDKKGCTNRISPLFWYYYDNYKSTS